MTLSNIWDRGGIGAHAVVIHDTMVTITGTSWLGRGNLILSSRLYIEFSGQPMEAPSLRIWAQWMLTTNRLVAKTRLPQGRLMVSTVFLGVVDALDVARPVLYETCVFAKAESSWADYRASYATREAALAGHKRLVQDITASWELDITTREAASFDEWNTAVEALLDEMERFGEAEERG